MSYQKWREEFLSEFATVFGSAATHDTACRFLRDASAEQRWSEIQCSIPISDAENARQEQREIRRHDRLERLAHSIGGRIEWQGDPRGCPFAVVKGDRHVHCRRLKTSYIDESSP